MRLRFILMILSFLTVLSASVGGYIYYSSLKESVFTEAERQAASRAEMIKRNISSFLSENIKPVRTLAGMKGLGDCLSSRNNASIEAANRVLDHFQHTLDAEACYLMDNSGVTIASSNRNAPDSFVGKNFSFRPYYHKAIQGKPAAYLALGITSGRRGAYYGHPIYQGKGHAPVGVAVIKASIELIEKDLQLGFDEIVLVTDPKGVIFISNRHEWLYNLLWRLPVEEILLIKVSQQFGKGPWKWSGLQENTEKHLVDPSGNKYLVHKVDLNNYPGWTVVHLQHLDAISNRISAPLIRISGPLIILLCFLIGLSVFFLYRKASNEIVQRKAAEKELRKSEERYRSIYHNTPAMLHSIDIKGRLVRVSDNWLEALGYRRDEVIGRGLIDFLNEESGKYAVEEVFPDFFRTGYCKDIPYQFVKKNGEKIDILLSAIGDRDLEGNVIQSLAVSIDVTDRIRVEKALKHTKEALSLYSKDLERQVRKRTREITSILKYTPAVVYIKDNNGKYILVNSRYEELFNVKNEVVQGKTDYEILPQRVADQFRDNDLKVLADRQPCQLEEHIPQADGEHTYFSVKFPLYNEAGLTNGVCGILTDITALKKAQDQLRRLSGSIMNNQEKERGAIARELHDELGQLLTALQMDAVWFRGRLKEKDPTAAKRADSMCHLIDRTIEEVRGLAFKLRPGVLDKLGLVDALELYTADFERRTGVTCVFENRNVPSIDDTVATAAYRIAQEALTNVARHSFANRVDFFLEGRGGELILDVVDNGKGFNIKGLSETEGLGLVGMRERANLVGGILDVRSEHGKGTGIYFRLSISDQRGVIS